MDLTMRETWETTFVCSDGELLVRLHQGWEPLNATLGNNGEPVWFLRRRTHVPVNVPA